MVALTRRAAPILLAAVILAGLPYLSYQVYYFAVTSPSFAVRQIEISGAHYAAREELLKAAEVAPGLNIFEIDTERVASDLERHDWVVSATAHTTLPGTLSLSVEEHEPAAILYGAGGGFLINADGEAFKPARFKDLPEALLEELPLLSGASAEELNQSASKRARLLEALHVWELWHERGLQEVAPVAQIHLDEVLGLSLIVGEEGVEVRLGWGEWETRLERFSVVYRDLSDRGVAADYILVDQEGEIDRVAVGPARAVD